MVFTYGFLFVWYCFNLYLWITRRTVFTDINFCKCSWAHADISRTKSGPMPEDHEHPILTLGLVTEIAPDSLSLLMILCSVLGYCNFTCIGEPLSVFTSERLSLSTMLLLYPVTDLLTNASAAVFLYCFLLWIKYCMSLWDLQSIVFMSQLSQNWICSCFILIWSWYTNIYTNTTSGVSVRSAAVWSREDFSYQRCSNYARVDS